MDGVPRQALERVDQLSPSTHKHDDVSFAQDSVLSERGGDSIDRLLRDTSWSFPCRTDGTHLNGTWSRRDDPARVPGSSMIGRITLHQKTIWMLKAS